MGREPGVGELGWDLNGKDLRFRVKNQGCKRTYLQLHEISTPLVLGLISGNCNISRKFHWISKYDNMYGAAND